MPATPACGSPSSCYRNAAASAGAFGLTSERPTNVTPSSTERRRALMSPFTVAVDFISILSRARMFPSMRPSMETDVAVTLPLTCAFLPRTAFPPHTSSPSSFPSSLTLSLLLKVPTISTSAPMTD